MRFVMSRIYALAIMVSLGWLFFAAFRASAPVAMIVSLFFGAIALRLSTGAIFNWGDGARWDFRCNYALTTGVLWLCIATGGILWFARTT